MAASRHALARAARILRGGGVVAHPTEGVFGLAADAFDAAAVARILALKGRDPAAGFIVLLPDLRWLDALSTLAEDAPARATMLESWPGPETWIVPAREGLPEWLTGGRDTLAVRSSAHPVAAALPALLGRPVVSTSANPSGLRPALDAQRVRRYFGGDVDLVIGGRPPRPGQPTRIRDVATGAILRG